MPRTEARAVGRRLAGEARQRVAPPVVRTLCQVHAARFHRARDDFGIGWQEVGRAQHVEHLPRGEGDHPLVMAADARDVVGRVPDPLLHQQEALLVQVERRLLPRRIDEAPVLRQRVDARLGLAAHRLEGVEGVLGRLALRLARELHLLAGRGREVPVPVGPGADQRRPRNAATRARNGRADRAVVVRERHRFREELLGGRVDGHATGRAGCGSLSGLVGLARGLDEGEGKGGHEALRKTAVAARPPVWTAPGEALSGWVANRVLR